MKGQWIGKYPGPAAGDLLINIDDRGSYYSGVAFSRPTNVLLPRTAIEIRTKDKKSEFSITSYLKPIDPRTHNPSEWDNVKLMYPNMEFAKTAQISGWFNKTSLFFQYANDLGLKFDVSLRRKLYSNKSDIKGEEITWNQFKRRISKVPQFRFIYRGQANNWKLRTSFHQKLRYDLSRYRREDIPLLHKSLSAKTKHLFNLNDAEEAGSFYSLIQHYGYPTPLLDWSHSPYVAAFFAFRKVNPREHETGVVRLYVFHRDKWEQDVQKIPLIDPEYPQLSVLDFMAIENDRLVPQQSISTLTNIDDIEAYIKVWNDRNNYVYLEAYDIRASERNTVIKELANMGITAGSLFPGIEGTCEEFRERFFGI